MPLQFIDLFYIVVFVIVLIWLTFFNKPDNRPYSLVPKIGDFTISAYQHKKYKIIGGNEKMIKLQDSKGHITFAHRDSLKPHTIVKPDYLK